jgi:hypothetical protein
VDAIEVRAVIELHFLVVNTDDSLPLCFLLKWGHVTGAQMQDHVSQGPVIDLSHEYIAL